MAAGKTRTVSFVPKPGFKELYRALKKSRPAIAESMKIFDRAKRKIPPDLLPASMNDHKLQGRLKGIRECHFAGDVLVLYTHENDIVELLDICTHDDLHGGKEKALAARLKTPRPSQPKP